MTPLRTAALTSAALTAFAANSLLCRAALLGGLVDAATFTTVRIVSGAAALLVLDRLWTPGDRAPAGGSWASAAALFAYAAAFSFAYVRIGAGVGALLLFAAVQATMIAWAVRSGERLRSVQWLGVLTALGGLVVLVRPGRAAPDALGSVLMIAAGIAWGVYTLRGRGVARALAATAANFARALPMAVALSVVAAGERHWSWRGALLAIASGALASGVGYSLWYAALRGLTAARAAVLQLTVPLLAAAGGVVLLSEPLRPRLVAAAVAIVAGVALAIRRPPAAATAR
ncbi:MAG TPA: DMT family transporter [Vicinamibacteria bacterium]